MASVPDLPTIVVSSEDPSSQDRSALEISIKTDPVLRATFGNDRTEEILCTPDSPPCRRPPSRRCSTEDPALVHGNGEQSLIPSVAKAPNDGIERGVQRSQTDVCPVDPPKRLSRSSTAGTLGSGKVKREPDLSALIRSAMKAMGEVGLDAPKSYLSKTSLSALLTDERIRKALKEPSEDLISFAKSNPKVLAITLLVHNVKASRTQAMEAFKLNKFTDDCLPVEKMHSEDVCSVQFKYKNSEDSNDSDESDDWDDSDDTSDELDISQPPEYGINVPHECGHRSVGDAFHNPPWTEQVFEVFYEKQWSFLVPEILEDVFEYSFGEHIILPFENSKRKSGISIPGGHFGEIHLAMMLADHQTAIKTDKPKIPVAIKEMRLHPGDEYNNYENWTRETKALRVFNGFHNPHTVRGVGAFEQREKYFILMEWADGGDLGNLWKTNPNAHLDISSARVAQFLEQFRGLAKALNQMHDYKIDSDSDILGLAQPGKQHSEAKNALEFKSSREAKQLSEAKVSEDQDFAFMESNKAKSELEEPGSTSAAFQDQRRRIQHVPSKNPEGEFKISEPPSNFENWRHGDLKPDNILCFKGEESSSWLGRLKLADLGRARQHMDKTGQRVGTSEIFGTLPYDPPEVWTSLLKGRSRLVDIWAFGCVLLESIVWLLFGFDELHTFRSRVAGIGSLYWTADSLANKTAMLNQLTFEWIHLLLETDPECRTSQNGTALRDLMLLITRKLLVIKLPADSDIFEEGCRINSYTLVTELDAIIQKGKQDLRYLFSGYNRAGIAAPKVTVTQVQEKRQFLSPDVDVKLNAANIAQNPTPAPWLARPTGGSGVRIDSYIHGFDDKWEYVDDTSFAFKVLQRPEIEMDKLAPHKPSSMLCDSCKSLNMDSPDFQIKCSVAQLRRRKKEERCELCALLLRAAEKFPDRDWVEFDMVTSGLRMNKNAGLPALTVRRTRDPRESPSGQPLRIHIGLPKIAKGGSLAHFGILDAWLDDCDNNHPACRTTRPRPCPTRVIDVGTLERPLLRLVESSSLPVAERKTLKYVALSYPWGMDPPHHHFVTNSKVIAAHRQEIPNSLPLTLADAVKTTRHLKIQYLWIDSLCIIQGPDGDFAQEADRMEAVFSSAYCVLAATSAGGSTSGFLERKSRREVDAVIDGKDDEQNPVFFRNRDKDGNPAGFIFVDEQFDDFDRDVLKGPLNQRGWVFQERALARRTIHFTNNQTYWECGEGIRCETLTKMKNTRVGFLGDPNFPSYGMQGSKGGDIVFYEDLYEQYSKLSFSKIEDRPFAISGLEQRLSQALRDKGGSDRGYWGIFDNYWGRGLLWRRADGVDRMIRLTTGASGGDPAPSWSWEGYSGAIKFLNPQPHTVEWLSREVTLPWNQARGPQAQMTTASYHGERCLRGVARDFTISGEELGDGVNHGIFYDDKADCVERQPLKVLIIGRRMLESCSGVTVQNYVLVLAKKKAAPENVYERIGVGLLDESLICFDQNVRSVLVE